MAGADLPDLTHVVLIDGAADPAAASPQLTLAELEQRGAEALAERARPDRADRRAASSPDHLATLIYTSGTTGRPKGVELLHGGWCWEGVAQVELGILRSDDLQYLWLPLSHSFGKTLICGVIHVGLPTYVDGRVDKIVENLGTIKPTLMCAAPRVFEKVYNRVVTQARRPPAAPSGRSSAGRSGSATEVALRAGRASRRRHAQGQARPRRQAGLQQAARAAGRPDPRPGLRRRAAGKDIAEFFHAAGLPICEGYGLTETRPARSSTGPDQLRFGTVGRPMGDLECASTRTARCCSAACRSCAATTTCPRRPRPLHRGRLLPDRRHRRARRRRLPADHRPQEGPDQDLRRQVRRAEPHRGHVQGDLPVHLAGPRDRPGPQLLHDAGHPRPRRHRRLGGRRAAGGQGVRARSSRSPEARARWSPATSRSSTRKLNRWETIKKFTILPRDLSIEDGEITPSMKVKRQGGGDQLRRPRSRRCTRRARRDLSPVERWAPIASARCDGLQRRGLRVLVARAADGMQPAWEVRRSGPDRRHCAVGGLENVLIWRLWSPT